MFTDSRIQTGHFSGVLFIGDPHCSSVAPGLRQDDYLNSTLKKLSSAAKLCHEKNLLPVITGDLIHRKDENSRILIHRLMTVLREFPVPPLDCEGNHGKRDSHLGEGDIESILHDAGVLNVHSRAGLMADITVSGHRVRLYGVGHGTPLPRSLAEYGATADSTNLLVSHHDLAFETSYPGAKQLEEVELCSHAINGHLHRTMPSVVVGQTTWHCPGNIEPVSIDLKDHVPKVWEWAHTPELVGHLVPHDPHCFDLTGRLVPAAASETSVAQLRNEDASRGIASSSMESAFARELSDNTADFNAPVTHDATAFRQEMNALLVENGASSAATDLLTLLLDRHLSKKAN